MFVEVLPCSGCFITCMGAQFPALELDNAMRFSTLSRMSGSLWQSSKWACRFGHFPQSMPGLEVLACSLDTEFNYVTLAMSPNCILSIASFFYFFHQMIALQKLFFNYKKLFLISRYSVLFISVHPSFYTCQPLL